MAITYTAVTDPNVTKWPAETVITTFDTVAEAQSFMLKELNAYMAQMCGDIDWYYIRASKSGGTAVPARVATYSADLYTEYAAKKTEIAALDTEAKILAYQVVPYTEVRKVEVVVEDRASTWHDSDTTSTAKQINEVVNFTCSPPDLAAEFRHRHADADPSFVSLTKD